MKKILLTIAAISVAVILIVPAVMGWQTQRYMMSLASYIDSLPEYVARWQSYDRGWFKSHGVLTIELEGVNEYLELSDEEVGDDSASIELPLDFNLRHGPVLFSSFNLGWFALTVELMEAHDETIKDYITPQSEGPIYQLKARMNLLGTTRFHDRVLPFIFEKNDHYLEMASAYEGEGSISLQGVVDYTAEAPSAHYHNELTYFDLEVLSSKILFDLAQMNDAGLAPSTFLMTLDRVELGSSDDKDNVMQWHNLSVGAETLFDTEAPTFDLVVKMGSEKMQLPDLSISSFNLSLSYNDIAHAFLSQYTQAMNELPDNANPLELQMLLGDAIAKHLLPYSPSFKIDTLDVATEEGNMSLDFLFTVAGDELSKLDLNPQNPMVLLPYLIAKTNGQIPKTLAVELAGFYVRAQIESQAEASGQTLSEQDIAAMVDAQAPSVIEMLLMQGFLVEDGGYYKTAMSYDKGQATLNGNPIPLPF